MNLFANRKLSQTLPMTIVAFSVSTAAITAALGYMSADNTFREQAKEQLHHALKAHEHSLSAWLESIEADIRANSENPTVREAIGGFSEAFAGLGASASEDLRRAYSSAESDGAGLPAVVSETGESVNYRDVHADYHPYFQGLLEEKGYYDILLMDRSGNVIYSVSKQADFASNALSGPAAETDLSQAYSKARSNASSGDLAFLDFKPYAPSDGAPASFLSTPITDEAGNFIGVLAYQMPIDRMNELVSRTEDLGETGSSVIVGGDFLMRNDTPLTSGDDILATRVDNEAVRKALAGQSGVMATPDLAGRAAFTAYDSFEFEGVRWAYLASKTKAEINAPAATVRNHMVIKIGITALVLGVLGVMVARRITRPLTAVRQAMEDVSNKKFELAIPHTDRQDEIGDMAKTLDTFKEKLAEADLMDQETAKTVEALGEALGSLSGGDLTYRIENDFHPKYEQLRRDFNSTMINLEEVLSSVVLSSNQIGDSAREISHAADDLSRRTESQAATLEETAAALEQITSSVSSTASSAKQAFDLVSSARNSAESSNKVVNDAVAAMGNIESSSNEIAQIIGVIDEIAFQTNLLALNAGVEAARAGDAGRGFAVVASEVRALAQRSSEAAKKIKDLITQSSSHVSDGVENVGQTGKVLKEIVEAVAKVSESVASISAAAQEQSTGVAEINTAVNQLDQVTQSNAAMVEESTAASHALTQDAEKLMQFVARFRFNRAGQTAMAAPAPTVTKKPVNAVSEQQQRVKAFAETQLSQAPAAAPKPASRGTSALKFEPDTSVDDEDWNDF